jgi:hypothetical protein
MREVSDTLTHLGDALFPMPLGNQRPALVKHAPPQPEHKFLFLTNGDHGLGVLMYGLYVEVELMDGNSMH